MSNLEEQLHKIRHSAEHVLTQAMVRLYGNEKVIMAMGPAIEDGFYFDFDSPEDFSISEDNFKEIEREMQKIINQNLPITRKEINVEEARKLFADNPYKQEWLDEIESKNEPVSIYWTAEEFVDLCAGPHVDSTGEIKAFKLLSVAGAYWHGDEKNKMLTRIYGTAFDSKEALAEHLHNLEEARKRDHRKLGKELDLFVFSDLVGKGLPMLTGKGETIRRELERFIVDEELKRGYQHVHTPPLAKVDLYRTSGHYPYYKNTMYPTMKVDEEELILRPMTCPHHFTLYNSRPHSYRELPVRMAEISPQFRYEKSGELTGLMRVRMFLLADAHIICQQEQAKQEIIHVLELIDFVNQTLGLAKGVDYRYRLSLGDRNNKDKYYQDDQAWEYAENVLREVLQQLDAPHYEAVDEAAFYGPKIDVQMKNVNGKEDTAFTVQYDFVMPKRFTMSYIGNDGVEKEPVVIHRASLGCFERTMAFLIEHFAGAFPLWLAPVQAVIIPISQDQIVAAKLAEESLKQVGIRVELWDQAESMQKRIRTAEKQKTPYMLIIGQKEAETGEVSVRVRGQQDRGVMPLEAFKTDVAERITSKSLDL
jgi:threonyl-tRNA synthetase